MSEEEVKEEELGVSKVKKVYVIIYISLLVLACFYFTLRFTTAFAQKVAVEKRISDAFFLINKFAEETGYGVSLGNSFGQRSHYWNRHSINLLVAKGEDFFVLRPVFENTWFTCNIARIEMAFSYNNSLPSIDVLKELKEGKGKEVLQKFNEFWNNTAEKEKAQGELAETIRPKTKEELITLLMKNHRKPGRKTQAEIDRDLKANEITNPFLKWIGDMFHAGVLSALHMDLDMKTGAIRFYFVTLLAISLIPAAKIFFAAGFRSYWKQLSLGLGLATLIGFICWAAAELYWKPHPLTPGYSTFKNMGKALALIGFAIYCFHYIYFLLIHQKKICSQERLDGGWKWGRLAVSGVIIASCGIVMLTTENLTFKTDEMSEGLVFAGWLGYFLTWIGCIIWTLGLLRGYKILWKPIGKDEWPLARLIAGSFPLIIAIPFIFLLLFILEG